MPTLPPPAARLAHLYALALVAARQAQAQSGQAVGTTNTVKTVKPESAPVLAQKEG